MTRPEHLPFYFTSPEIPRSLREQLSFELYKELYALRKLVHFGYLSYDTIASIPARLLRETALRTDVADNNGRLVFRDMYDLTQEEIADKFMVLTGRTPQDMQRHLDDGLLDDATSQAIHRYNTTHDSARMLGIVFGGSFFQEGKTPSLRSDLDADAVCETGGLFDHNKAQEIFQDELIRRFPGLRLDLHAYRSDTMLQTLRAEIASETPVSIPYRETRGDHRMALGSVYFGTSDSYTKPNIAEIVALLPFLPPHISELPFSLSFERPSTDLWPDILPALSSPQIAQLTKQVEYHSIHIL